MKIDLTTKILCVGSFYGPSNAWRRKERLKALGYDVCEMNTSNLGMVEWETIRRIIIKFCKPLFVTILERTLIQTVRQHQPQVIFFEKSQWLRPRTFSKLRDAGPVGMVLAHYNPDEFFDSDNPNKWGFFLEAIPYYDVHFIPKPSNLQGYLDHGGKHIHVFDRSFDPSFHRPVPLSPEEKERFGCEIGFIGKWAPHREQVIAEVIRSGIPVAVWGNGWYRGPHWETIRPHWRGPAQYGEEYPKAICGMGIALHFLRKENFDEQDSRSFELPACGACMVAGRSPAHERLFEEGKEAFFFDETSELISILKDLQANPDLCKQIGEQAREKSVHSPYDHDARLTEFLSFIEHATST